MSQLRKYSQRPAVLLNGRRLFSGSVAFQLLLAVMLVASIGLFALSRITSVQAREEAAAPVAQVESAPSPDAGLSEAPSSESPFEKLVRRSQRPVALATLPVELTLTEKVNQGVLALLILLIIVLLVPKASRALGHWLAASDQPRANPEHAAAELLSRVALAEEHASFDSFVSSFRVGVHAQVAPPISKPSSNDVTSPTPSAPQLQTNAQAIKDARSELANLRLFLRELNLCSPETRQLVLKKAVASLLSVKHLVDSLAFRPASLLTSALLGLWQQLAEKPGSVTPSNLRTSAAALDLLENLCADGIRSELADSPPPRFLAVDDDLICRRALGVALAGPFGAPSLAADGQEALRLASEQQFDVVFLDIEMPGMDGFEVCTALRATYSHKSTPIVFVTSHTGFDARAKSITSGGNDFIAKPFLKTELAVKALTLLLNARLGNKTPGPATPSPKLSQSAPPNTPSKPPVASAPSSTAVTTATNSVPASKVSLDPADPAHDLLKMRDALSCLSAPDAPDSHQELFKELLPPLLLLASRAKLAGAQAEHQLASATVNLLRKVVEKPTLRTESIVPTLSNALDLLQSLHSQATVTSNAPAARILVVDDDAISRRTIATAVQLTLPQPTLAESGEAALAVAEKSAFDLIFMDVLMPGMDGFETTARLRQLELHRNTPIVFVTGQADTASRAKATTSGGNGFIAKPILPPELALIALTLHLKPRG